jgi:hypothetical protein
VGRVAKLLESVGSPVPVLGAIADDSDGSAALWSGTVSKRVLRRSLFGSARAVLDRMWAVWPELSEPPAPGRSEWSAVTAGIRR